MKVKRTVKCKTNKYKRGDIIQFKLNDGEKIEAIALKQIGDTMLFIFKDCLKKKYPMFSSLNNIDEEDISYFNSDLRKMLNEKILDRFPKKIRDRMVPINYVGDMLRIPSEREIFGENVFGENESETVKRWKIMKKKRNRIAFQGKDGGYSWYWLINRHKGYLFMFSHVLGDGSVDYGDASEPNGVRPLFLLENRIVTEEEVI